MVNGDGVDVDGVFRGEVGGLGGIGGVDMGKRVFGVVNGLGKSNRDMGIIGDMGMV